MAIFLYVWFCVNPFSEEEMLQFQEEALKNVTILNPAVMATTP